MSQTLLLLLFGASAVTSHGFMSSPKSRNYLARERGDHYCPHCLNAGTVGTVRANSEDGRWTYPETEASSSRHGLCGDAADGPQNYMAGGSLVTGIDGDVVSNYEPGAVIPVTMAITTHHRGHVEFSICDKGTLDDPNGPITQTCLNEHKLEVVGDPSDPLSFTDENYPNRYYLPPICAGDSAEKNVLYPAAYSYTAMVRLPEDLECEHCVLQFYYITGNTCNAPGYRTADWPTDFGDCSGDGPGSGWWGQALRDCYDSYPEEFWNCADISIGSGGNGRPTTPPSPTPVTPSPTPSVVNPSEPPTASTPTTAPPTTAAPTLGGGSVSCDNFVVTSNCWNSGCTIRVAVSDWVPNQLVTMRFADSAARIPDIWNAQVMTSDNDGSSLVVTARLASYNSDNFGFNLRGSTVMPTFVCDGDNTPTTSSPTTSPPTATPTSESTSSPTSFFTETRPTPSPTSAVITDSPTAPPTNNEAAGECAGFSMSRECWNSGCTVQVAVASWEPAQDVRLVFPTATGISSIWNANIVGNEGSTTLVRLANHNSDNFGFVQTSGQTALPRLECSGGQPSQPTPSPTASTQVTPTPTAPPTGSAPTSPPARPTTTTTAPTRPPTTAGASNWDMSTNKIMYQGRPVQVQGFAVTCLEYLLRGIGAKCLAEYNWNDAANIITTPSEEEVSALLNHLSLSTTNADSQVLPAVRFSLNAAYWLDVETTMWANNRARYPDLAAQYRTLVGSLVERFTAENVAVILDLHWNDDVTEQQAMALRASDFTRNPTGDSVEFWTSLAMTFGQNDLVMYELYNEPFASSYDIWLNGGNGFEGMQVMYNAVRRYTNNPVVIGGQRNYAYDADSLVAFEGDVQPFNVLYNIHPYMGPYQKDDSSKNIPGYEARVQTILQGTGKPLIITEFGQYCCPANGACYLYSGQYDGQSMGYVEAVMNINVKYDVSWTTWAWRPNSGASAGDCNQPDANDGTELYDAANHNGNGADWKTLFPKFYELVTSA